MTERHGEPRQPGWYPDEAGNIRWWNGQFWSHTSQSAVVRQAQAAQLPGRSAEPPAPEAAGDGLLLGAGAVVTGLVGAAAGLYAFVQPVGELGNFAVFPPVVLGIVAVGLGIGALRRRRLLLGVAGVVAGTASFMLTALLILVLATLTF
ncbi:DUF2510 domain-containing protein [Jiangella alkaliphila]|uniref:DUF2510 domain-containing protein n=1 Tax=Jiangella alkaliphila TaxID=419479 RepID=A0A1H2KGE2_9ACTN|nr:DUF2510 domain-containing protein [Jiangella alkaliphila]SDU67446.1 Protein of unknown function [Jiangella alkaliphila]